MRDNARGGGQSGGLLSRRLSDRIGHPLVELRTKRCGGILVRLSATQVLRLCLSAFWAVTVSAQTPTHVVYFGVSAGAVVEEGELSVRSSVGPVIGLTVGREVRDQFAIQAEATRAIFGAPTYSPSPGGCLGTLPCPQSSSTVRATTIGGGAVFSARAALAPFLVLGGGVRHVSEPPYYNGETRPYSEIGGGFLALLGGHQIGVETRVQLATASGTLPRWMVPTTVGIRF